MYITTEGAEVSGYSPSNITSGGSKNWGSFLETLVNKMYDLILDLADDGKVITAQGAELEGVAAQVHVQWELGQSVTLANTVYNFYNTLDEHYDILSNIIRGA